MVWERSWGGARRIGGVSCPGAGAGASAILTQGRLSESNEMCVKLNSN